jgi:phosphoglycolate phosphatase-like HAD superfamily hydrolase
VGRSPAEALFVGDSTVDVIAGNAAGVVMVAATWGACTRDAFAAAWPAHFLDDIAGHPGLVAALAGAPAA